MTEADILALTYEDEMTVYRSASHEDEVSGESKFSETTVHTAVPCALSKDGNNQGVPSDSTVEGEFEAGYTLFARPEILLEANDRIVVVKPGGVVFNGRSGRTNPYLDHGETPFEIHETA